jgi:hypothetical protein
MGDPHTVYIEIEDEEQYEELQRIKKKHGLTWKGLLLQGARRMEGEDAI